MCLWQKIYQLMKFCKPLGSNHRFAQLKVSTNGPQVLGGEERNLKTILQWCLQKEDANHVAVTTKQEVKVSLTSVNKLHQTIKLQDIAVTHQNQKKRKEDVQGHLLSR